MKFHYLIPLFFQKLIWIPTRLCLIFFGRLEVKGANNLRDIQGPAIFAVNHSSEIDPFMVPASLPFFSRFSPLFYAVREKSFYKSNGWRQYLFNGWFINMWGGYSVTTGLRDYEKALARHVELLREGNNFCVFPEGGITKNGEIQSARGGISFLAHSAPCSIVPVAISGVYDMSPFDFLMRKRKLRVHFGSPIRSEELYSKLDAVHVPGESVWKKEADFVMKKVGELMHTPSIRSEKI